jgi:AraC-like DNA-binding protein
MMFPTISFVSRSPAINYFNGRVVKLERDLRKFIFMLIDESRKTFDLMSSNVNTKKMPLLESPTLGGIQVIKNLLEVLLISIMREGGGDKESPVFVLKEDFDEYITDQVIQYLVENIHRQVTIEEICRNLNYARSYLFRQFKSVTDQSIMSYFISLKIKEAKRLLRETDLTVTQISASLAFDNPNYFSKTFKRVSGYTPLQYKKMRRLPNR